MFSWLGLSERLSIARPAWRLLRRDRAAMRAWARYRGAVAEALGEEAAERYTQCVVAVAEVDGEIARTLALTIPDQLPRILPEMRERYFEHLIALIPLRPEALPMVARALPDLLGTLGEEALGAFLREGVELHGQSHQRAESFLKQESEVGQLARQRLQRGLGLAQVSRVMSLYARAHCGEDVQIRGGSGQAFSDGHHVYLPEQIDRFGDERDFLMYRVLTALSAGYLEFGTFDLRLDQIPGEWPERREGEGEVERFFRSFPNRTLARDLFQILEDVRVERRIRAEYPGVARDLDQLGAAVRGDRPEPPGAAARAVEVLARRAWGLPGLRVADPAEAAAIDGAVEALIGRLGGAGGLEGLGAASVQEVAAAVAASYAQFDGLMRKAEPGQKPGQRPGGGPERGPEREQSREQSRRGPERGAKPEGQVPQGIRPEAARPEDRRVEEEARRIWEREPIRPQEARQRLRRERAEEQARRERPGSGAERRDEGTEAEGPGGAVVPPEPEQERRKPSGNRPEADPDLLPGERIFRYREWDSNIGDYKPDWVCVRERRLKEGSQTYVAEVMQRHRHRIQELRRRFEALRPQAMVRQDRLWDGTDLDLDRLVEDRINQRLGGERTDRVYTRDVRARRDVAVAFLLDMSSSTNESADGSARRIIDVEKEALILTAEAIHALGDSFAIFGFSGYGRGQVQFFVAKDFGEPWDDRARARVGRIGFKMENRDGAAIRHATERLRRWSARTRLLIHISDGKPLDCGCDHYYDRYAQEDTRVALREARQVGIHPFCITVDPMARAYLPRMFGEVAYTVIDRVELLPARLVQVYRRLAV